MSQVLCQSHRTDVIEADLFLGVVVREQQTSRAAIFPIYQLLDCILHMIALR